MDPVLKLKVAGFAQNTVTINVKMFQMEYRISHRQIIQISQLNEIHFVFVANLKINHQE